MKKRTVIERLKFDGGHLPIIGTYVPKENKGNETQKYHAVLQRKLSKLNQNNYVIIVGEINSRIGQDHMFTCDRSPLVLNIH